MNRRVTKIRDRIQVETVVKAKLGPEAEPD